MNFHPQLGGSDDCNIVLKETLNAETGFALRMSERCG